MRARPHQPAAAAMARPSAGHSNSLRHLLWRSPKVSAATPCPSSRTLGMAPTTSASPASPLTSRRCPSRPMCRPYLRSARRGSASSWRTSTWCWRQLTGAGENGMCARNSSQLPLVQANEAARRSGTPPPSPNMVADLGRRRLLSRRLGLGWDMWCGDETDWVWFDRTQSR
uniref:Uncharacterized protein n=1 Tax=Oryza barthii TaxID=65489 RepID=A0A0D3FKP4_9ORYZ